MEKLNLSALQEIFGRAILAKLRERPTRHQMPGRHTGKHHGLIPVMVKDQERTRPCTHVHPAGTKLVRRFIRQARGEQVAYRKLYAQLTGHQLP